MIRMSKTTVLVAGALATLLLGGPVFAKTDTESTTKGTTAAPAEKPSKFALPHHVTGEVVSMDRSAKTLIVRDSMGKEFTLTANGDAAARLSDFKPGDRVKVSYKKSHGQMIASKIAQSQAAKTK